MITYLCFSCGKTTIDHCRIRCDHACSNCSMTNIYDIDILKILPEYKDVIEKLM